MFFYSSFHTKRAWNSDCQKQSLRKWYEGIKIAEIAKTIDAKLEQETREKKLGIEYMIEFPDVYHKRLWTSLSEFYQTKSTTEILNQSLKRNWTYILWHNLLFLTKNPQFSSFWMFFLVWSTNIRFRNINQKILGKSRNRIQSEVEPATILLLLV